MYWKDHDKVNKDMIRLDDTIPVTSEQRNVIKNKKTHQKREFVETP